MEDVGSLLSVRRNGVSHFYHYDGLGSTVQLTDVNQQVTDTYVYQAFGEEKAISGTTVNPYRFGGKVGYYKETNLTQHYVRARHYSPSVSRWLSRDPAGFVDGINWYAYVINLPTRFLDPSGYAAAVNIRNHGDGKGCIIVAFHGLGSGPFDQQVGMYKALNGVDGHHFVAGAKHNAKMTDTLSAEIKKRCCPPCGVCVFLLGHSWGGKTAINMADWFSTEIGKLCPNSKPDIYLQTIDAIETNLDAVKQGPKIKVTTFQNFYQQILSTTAPIMGAAITGAKNNFDVSEELQNWMEKQEPPQKDGHRAIDEYVVEAENVPSFLQKRADKWYKWCEDKKAGKVK